MESVGQEQLLPGRQRAAEGPHCLVTAVSVSAVAAHREKATGPLCKVVIPLVSMLGCNICSWYSLTTAWLLTCLAPCAAGFQNRSKYPYWSSIPQLCI